MKKCVAIVLSSVLVGVVSCQGDNLEDTIQQAALLTTDTKTLPLDELLKKSDFVFEGEVQKITYRNSSSSEEQKPVVHTFVTYSVERVFKGRADSEKEFTLRIIGGPVGESRFLLVPHFPTFDTGDRDVLFVAGNGKSICPLVLCELGRLRIIDNEVRDEYGYSLIKSPTDEIVFGPRRDSIQTLTYKVGDIELKRKFSTTQSSESPKVKGREDPESIRYEVFSAYLEQKALDVPERIVEAKTADPEEPFYIAISQPSAFREGIK